MSDQNRDTPPIQRVIHRQRLPAPRRMWLANRLKESAVALLIAFSANAPGLFARQAWASTTDSSLPSPRALRPLLQIAADEKLPLIVFFSLKGCAWCERLRREQLLGMLPGIAARGIQLIEFDMQDTRHFDETPALVNERQAATTASKTIQSPISSSQSAAALAQQLKVRVAPTVVFLGPQGEIAERLVGYNSPDFYSAYLDERIEQARAALAKQR